MKAVPASSRTSLLLHAALVLVFVSVCCAKVFERCELAAELAKLGVEKDKIPTWVCIASHESTFNSAAVGNANGDGSKDHGIFQISDKYWCSAPGNPQGANVCGKDCKDFEDDDLSDDWKCVKRIFKAHRLQEGDGFKAWTVYPLYCSGDTSRYVEGCQTFVTPASTKYVPNVLSNELQLVSNYLRSAYRHTPSVVHLIYRQYPTVWHRLRNANNLRFL